MSNAGPQWPLLSLSGLTTTGIHGMLPPSLQNLNREGAKDTKRDVEEGESG
jgi:hypothetical protein